MIENKTAKYQAELKRLQERLRDDTQSLEQETRTPTGGDADGNLSSVPMHLGDLGTETYLQELNSTLLESESSLRDEVLAALKRIEEGNYGHCENCGRKINPTRLDALPYARYCTTCAEQVENDQVNLNSGRILETGIESIHPQDIDDRESDIGPDGKTEILFTDLAARSVRDHADVHAAGTPGGGSAIGGLAGTNVGGGDPDDADLENAMGSGNFDIEKEDEEELDAYSGSGGGAVGGTPAGKRAVGGKRTGRPQSERGRGGPKRRRP